MHYPETQALVLASRLAASQVHSHIFNVTRREESNREEWIREPGQHATRQAYPGDEDRSTLYYGRG